FDEAGGYQTSYTSVLAQHKTLTFGGAGSLVSEQYYQGYPGFYWGFPPPLETRAQQWASFVCSRIWHQPVSFNGDGKNGQPRKLGLLTTTDQTAPDTMEQQKLSLEAL